MKNALPSAVATVAILLLASPAAAQESTFPSSGSWSLSATLPDGGGNIVGIWRMVSSRLNVGLEVDYRRQQAEDRSSPSYLSPNTITDDALLIFGPSARFYLRPGRAIAPYVRASFGIQRRDVEIRQANTGDTLQHQEESATVWRVAVGADWFPLEDVGIGFFTGVVGVVSDMDIEFGTSGSITRRNENLSTFQSGIQLQFYF